MSHFPLPIRKVSNSMSMKGVSSSFNEAGAPGSHCPVYTDDTKDAKVMNSLFRRMSEDTDDEMGFIYLVAAPNNPRGWYLARIRVVTSGDKKFEGFVKGATHVAELYYGSPLTPWQLYFTYDESDPVFVI